MAATIKTLPPPFLPKQTDFHALLTAVMLLIILPSCLHTISPRNSAAGLNLGFEHSKNGLPANWILYDPPQSTYKITLDTVQFAEGKQSLRFDITRAASTGPLTYTGFTNEFIALTKGGGRYTLRFRITNAGTRPEITVSAVKAKGNGNGPVPVRLQVPREVTTWTLFEATIDVPPDHWLKFETKIFEEGTFRIDDVTIVKEHP